MNHPTGDFLDAVDKAASRSLWTDHIGELQKMASTETVASLREALSMAVGLLEGAEYAGKCSPDGDCSRCAWDSNQELFLKRWGHLR